MEKNGFTLIALLGFYNIVTDEVPLSIAKFKKSEINLRMFSDETIENSKSIALKWGLINENDADNQILEGQKFFELIGGVVCQVCQTPVCACPRDHLNS